MTEHLVRRVFSDEFIAYWPLIEGELDRVPEVWERWWTKESLYYGVLNGRFQLWFAGTKEEVHIVLLTQVAEYPTGSILQGVLAFGNHLDESLDALVGTMQHFARESGCREFEIHGRPGWGRLLRGMHPTVTSIVSFKVPQERVQ